MYNASTKRRTCSRGTKHHDILADVYRSMTTRMIRRRLSERLDVNILEERGVLPHGFYVDAEIDVTKPKLVSPALASRVRQLDRLLLDTRLQRALRRRRSLSDMQNAGFITSNSMAS